MVSTPTPNHPQFTLPGQAHTAEGPHDQGGMYCIHFAFRRDFARFLKAATSTPVEDSSAWAALAQRWAKVSEVLHHHHSVEDAELWPLLRGHSRRLGDEQALAVLGAMETEHGAIGPALTAAAEGFAHMVEHPSADHRTALIARVGAVQDHLLTHLAHEESEALPLLQSTLSESENAAFEKAAEKAYPLRIAPFIMCWVLDELPATGRDWLFAAAPPGYGLLARVFGRGYRRRTSAAFRHV